jgi:hypothetical protein
VTTAEITPLRSRTRQSIEPPPFGGAPTGRSIASSVCRQRLPLPGYVWLDVAGRATRRLQSELEIRHSDPQCDG